MVGCCDCGVAMSVKGDWKRVVASEEDYGKNHDGINWASKQKARVGAERKVTDKQQKEGK